MSAQDRLTADVLKDQDRQLPRALNWIDGKWIGADKYSPSVDPATGEVIGEYAHATVSDVQVAIDAAERAFRRSDWKENRTLRSKVLHQLADRFEARRQDLIDILSLE